MSYSSQHHSFDIKLAALYGIEKAILIHHFQHWIRLNRNKSKNIKEGRCWSYQTRDFIVSNFPYFTLDSVRHHLEGLVKLGILRCQNFNKLKMDKTLWYAFENEALFGVDAVGVNSFYNTENKEIFTKGENPVRSGENPFPCGENPKAIPDTKEKILKKKKERETEAKASVSTRFVYKRVEMGNEDIARLINSHGNEKIKEMLERLDEYADLNPKRFKQYANHATVISKWIREDEQKEPKKKEDKVTANANWAVKFQAKMGNVCKFEALSKYAEFRGYGNAPSLVIPYTENGFKEQVLNQTRKMGLIHLWEEE